MSTVEAETKPALPLQVTVPLYLTNQTKKAMMEVWISYVGTSKNAKGELVEQNSYVSSPIPVGPTNVFIGNIKVPRETTQRSSGDDDKQEDAKHVAGTRQKNSWKLYWRDEGNSLKGLSSPLVAAVEGKNGLVSLYVVSDQDSSSGKGKLRVNQEGSTVGSPGDWTTLLYIPPPAEEATDGE